MANDMIYRKYHGMDDQEWVDVIVSTATKTNIDGVEFPGLPDDETQRRIAATSGEASLRQASKFYLAIMEYCNALDVSFNDTGGILDFGCGYGRHIRFFLKDVPPEMLMGVDISENMISLAKQTLPMCTFIQIGPWPPLNVDNFRCNLIYAHSVFSHLGEQVAQAWVDEFARLLNPGGLLIVTTRSRRFIDKCAAIRRESDLDTPHKRDLARYVFLDGVRTRLDYLQGRYCYSEIRDSAEIVNPNMYGEAVIPLRYVYNHWLDAFDLVDFVDDEQRFHQAIITLQRKS
jgi:SAM-dependent methyltransferase